MVIDLELETSDRCKIFLMSASEWKHVSVSDYAACLRLTQLDVTSLGIFCDEKI